MGPEQRFQIGDLATLAGISRRAVRYYVQRALIPPPLGAGRGHYYTEEHLRRLLNIKLLQDRGLSLEQIDRHLAEAGSSAPPASLSAAPPADLSLWTRVGVAAGIELHVEGGRYRLSPARLQRLRQAVHEIIGDPFPSERDTDKGDVDDAQD